MLPDNSPISINKLLIANCKMSSQLSRKGLCNLEGQGDASCHSKKVFKDFFSNLLRKMLSSMIPSMKLICLVVTSLLPVLAIRIQP